MVKRWLTPLSLPVWQDRISPRILFFKDSTCAWSKDDQPWTCWIFKKLILGVSLGSHTCGVNHLCDHGHVESLKKIEVRAWSVKPRVGQSSFWPWTCWILKKKSRWEPVQSYLGGSVIFWPCTCWIFTKNSRWDPGLSNPRGVSHLLATKLYLHIHCFTTEAHNWCFCSSQ